MNDEDALSFVLGEIGSYAGVDQLMVIGAVRRNIHQASFRDTAPSRSTDDIDIGVVVEGWETIRELQRAFPSASGAWQEIEVGGITVDIVPFGSVESPPGEVAVGDGIVMNVAGFREVFGCSDIYETTDGVRFRIPSVAGLAALKLHAWLDRYPEGKYKDAQDLGLIIAWYATGDDVWLFNRFFEFKRADEAEVSEVMAAFVLGIEVAEVLGETASAYLLQRFKDETEIGLDLFAEKLVAPGEYWASAKVRSDQVRALLDGLACGGAG